MPQTLSESLLRELRQATAADRVFSDAVDLLAFEYDGTIDRALPAVVVLPNNVTEVSSVLRIAQQHNLPVTPRGAGTGLSGGALAAVGGIMLVMTRMNRLLEVDTENRTALVEPGVVNLELSAQVAEHELYYAPDPSSQRACTIGGNVAENAGGPHCLAYGVTTNHVLGLEVVLADGAVIWVGGAAADLPGYDLPGIVVGSEGTLCVITKVLVRLSRLPASVRTLLAIFDSIEAASDAVSAIFGRGLLPTAVEMLDNEIIQAVEAAFEVGYPLDAGAVLLVEVEGLAEETSEAAAGIRSTCLEGGAREVREATDAADRERLWLGRKAAISAIGRIVPNYYVLDGVVPRTKLPEVMASVGEVSRRSGLGIANVFHAGDGNLHPNILFDQRVEGSTQRVLDAGEQIMRICIEAGGSITGEHGVGLEKRSYLPWIFSEAEMASMEKLKIAFRTDERFNPCKIFPTSKGCGEIHSGALQSFGPDASI